MDKLGIADIIHNDLCVGCGACVSESENIKGMIWDKNGFLIPDINPNFEESSNAIKACPFNLKYDRLFQSEEILSRKYLSEAPLFNKDVGRYYEAYVGYSTSFRDKSSSGGLATYIFEQLLKKNIVNSIFAVKESNGSYSYQFFDDLSKIEEVSKTRYIPVSMVDLFDKINLVEGKVAVAGVACFVKAIRLKQELHPEIKEKIPFIIGIICGGLKSSFFTDYLAQKAQIIGNYRDQDYRMKDKDSLAHDYSFGAFDKNDVLKTVKMRSLGDMWGTGLFKSNACDFCYDVTTELADISLGDAWLEPYINDGMGNSVILTRSKLADELIISGISNNQLEVSILPVSKFIASQKGSFNHRRLGLKYRMELREKNGFKVPQRASDELQQIPKEFKIVQKYRMELREESLNIWRKYKNAAQFETGIENNKLKLRLYTKIYHKVQQIKKKLGFKTI